MKNALRLCGMVAVLSLAALSGVRDAQAGTCQVRCTDGRTDNTPTATRFECCNKIETFCGGAGRAAYNGAQCPL